MPNKDAMPPAAQLTVQAILQLHPNIEKAILFGSRALGTHSPSSDIDLAVVGENLTLESLGRLASEFDESSLPVFVDVLRYDTIKSEPLREHIARYGKMLWERSNSAIRS